MLVLKIVAAGRWFVLCFSFPFKIPIYSRWVHNCLILILVNNFFLLSNSVCTYFMVFFFDYRMRACFNFSTIYFGLSDMETVHDSMLCYRPMNSVLMLNTLAMCPFCDLYITVFLSLSPSPSLSISVFGSICCS